MVEERWLKRSFPRYNSFGPWLRNFKPRYRATSLATKSLHYTVSTLPFAFVVNYFYLVVGKNLRIEQFCHFLVKNTERFFLFFFLLVEMHYAYRLVLTSWLCRERPSVCDLPAKFSLSSPLSHPRTRIRPFPRELCSLGDFFFYDKIFNTVFLKYSQVQWRYTCSCDKKLSRRLQWSPDLFTSVYDQFFNLSLFSLRTSY